MLPGELPETFESIGEAFFNDPRRTIPLPDHDFHGGSAAMHARGSLIDPQTETNITDGWIAFKQADGGTNERVKVLVFPGRHLQGPGNFADILCTRAAFQEGEPAQSIATPDRFKTRVTNLLFAVMGKRPDHLTMDITSRMVEIVEECRVERREPYSPKTGQALCQHDGVIRQA